MLMRRIHIPEECSTRLVGRGGYMHRRLINFTKCRIEVHGKRWGRNRPKARRRDKNGIAELTTLPERCMSQLRPVYKITHCRAIYSVGSLLLLLLLLDRPRSRSCKTGTR